MAKVSEDWTTPAGSKVTSCDICSTPIVKLRHGNVWRHKRDNLQYSRLRRPHLARPRVRG